MHTGFPWVTVIGLLPLVGIVGIVALPKAREAEAKVIALVASLAAMLASIIMAFAYKSNGARFQFTQDYNWIKAFGAHYAVGVDGIALALILMTTILTPICILASWHDGDRAADADPTTGGGRGPKLFFSLLLATETLVVGVFGALDVFFFYVLFEAMLVPMYFLIGSFGGPRRSYAAVKFLLYSLAGGLLMLVAVIALYVVSVHQLGTGTFDYRVLISGRLHISHGEQVALFLGFFIAFAIKAPLWPFHTWLPDAASEAPTGTAVMLVGVLDKVGTFGFLRFCIPLFPYASKLLAPYILGLCVDRHSVRRAARDRPARPQAARRLLLGVALRLHRVGGLRVHDAGRVGRDALHGQPRVLDRRAVPRRRLHGIAAWIAAGGRLRRCRQGRALARSGRADRGPLRAGAARAVDLRQ